jgi:dipeptidyl-peptidase-3
MPPSYARGFFLMTMLTFSLLESQPASAAQRPALVDRVGDTGFLQIYADSFNSLSARQKIYAYWLAQAAIAINPIVYDQNSAYGLREKRLIDAIMSHPQGIDPAVMSTITDYAKLFWGNHGNHNSFTSKKFVPRFTPAQFKAAAHQALKNGATLGNTAQLDAELEALEKPIFDPDFQPMLTVKNPPAGQDALQASGNNLYQDVTLAELKNFTEHFALNSRLERQNGTLVEQVYRAGTPDGSVPPGLYARELANAIRILEKAKPYADEAQQKVLADLIRYYQTGSPADWRQFNIDWVRDNSRVDFTNGFIEVYKDARGMKGASQAYVTVNDETLDKLMKTFAANAAYFERHAPWLDKYKLSNPHPPAAKAVEALIETGDFDVMTIGENLPNEAEIHDKFGSKSFIFTGSMRAFAAAQGEKIALGFAYSPEEVERAIKYRDQASNILVALHEIIGHGSGKLDPKLTHEPAYYIKEYYSTLEEARADLMALWNFFDPKLIELGAMPNLEVAKAAYDNEARAALVQLHEVPTGNTIEEDHRRGTQLIVNYIRERTGAIQPRERDGKIYMVVEDYGKMREGVGMLLAELMRIKAEGDYDAAKALITQYGVHFNTQWRDQVVARYKKLDLPTYWVGINPMLVPHRNAQGQIEDVEITYPADFVKQQMEYTRVAGE